MLTILTKKYLPTKNSDKKNSQVRFFRPGICGHYGVQRRSGWRSSFSGRQKFLRMDRINFYPKVIYAKDYRHKILDLHFLLVHFLWPPSIIFQWWEVSSEVWKRRCTISEVSAPPDHLHFRYYDGLCLRHFANQLSGKSPRKQSRLWSHDHKQS